MCFLGYFVQVIREDEQFWVPLMAAAWAIQNGKRVTHRYHHDCANDRAPRSLEGNKTNE